MKQLFFWCTLSILAIFALPLSAQQSADTLIKAPLMKISYAYQFPGGDLEERFGNNSNVGISFDWKTKNNWLLGIESQLMFGNNVREDNILDQILNDAGDATTADGEIVQVILEQRGFAFFLQGGRVFNFIGLNQNSGLMLQAGVGFLQHRIRIDFRDGDVFQLTEEMRKGYDRLSYGIAFKQFVGYQYLGNRRLINFYAGFELVQGFTQNRRGFNFDTMRDDTDQRTDLLSGLRFGWIIPFYKRSTDVYYFN